MYYVYIFLDPRKPGLFEYGPHTFNYEPFYVGKGCKNRIYDSMKLKDSRKCKNHFKRNKINKIKTEGHDVISFKLYENIDENSAHAIETLLISLIGKIIDKTGPLVNICNGGEGVSGYKHSKEVRLKIGKKSRGRVTSEETKRKISNSNKGRIKSPEECEAISKRMLGKKLSQKTKDKLSRINSVPKPNTRKKFKVVSPEGKEYIVDYLEEFCKKHGLNYNSMTALSRGKRKSNNHMGWTCSKLKRNKNG